MRFRFINKTAGEKVKMVIPAHNERAAVEIIDNRLKRGGLTLEKVNNSFWLVRDLRGRKVGQLVKLN